MMKNSISLFFATVFFLSLFSCTEKEEPTVDNLADYRFEFSAVKSMEDDSSAGQGSVDTRVLTENGNDLKATFKKGDLVYMYKVTFGEYGFPVSYKEVGILTAMDDGVETNLEGPIDPDLLVDFHEDNGYLVPNNENFALYFFYKHKPSEGFVFQGQKGTLEDIDNNFDYACAENFTSNDHYDTSTYPFKWYKTDYLKIDYDNRIISVPNKIRFHSQQSVFKFTLKDKSGKPIKADKFTIDTDVYHEPGQSYYDPGYGYKFIRNFAPFAESDGFQQGKIEVNLDTASDVVYVALAGTSTDYDDLRSYWRPIYFRWNSLLYHCNIVITATVGDLTYRYTKLLNYGFSFGYFYSIEVRMDGPITDPSVLFDVTDSSRYGEGQTIN